MITNTALCNGEIITVNEIDPEKIPFYLVDFLITNFESAQIEDALAIKIIGEKEENGHNYRRYILIDVTKDEEGRLKLSAAYYNDVRDFSEAW